MGYEIITWLESGDERHWCNAKVCEDMLKYRGVPDSEIQTVITDAESKADYS
jgi:hypothetical protein